MTPPPRCDGCPTRASRTRCTWGGGDRNNPCPDDPEYTVTDKSRHPPVLL
ncbi:hypothetical protein [Nonomuraea sp. NPDC050202]